MSNGKHVTKGDCEEMRDLANREFFHELIARRFDVSVQAVWYHVHGNCTHE